MVYELTTGVVTGGQQDTTSRLPLSYEMTGSRGAQDTVLTNEDLLDAVGGTDLGNLLDSLGIVVTAITTDDEV